MKFLPNLENFNDIIELENEYSIENNTPTMSEVGEKAFIALSELNSVDRRLFILYCEYSSCSKLADDLKVSKSTIQKKIKNIKNKLLKKINNG